MIAYLTIKSNGKRFLAQVLTSAGALVGQAIDADRSTARKRAMRQAYRWAENRGFKPFVVKDRTGANP